MGRDKLRNLRLVQFGISIHTPRVGRDFNS